ncbi:MAG: hypothetical protein WBG86_16775 [Polyangiales bacterium]
MAHSRAWLVVFALSVACGGSESGAGGEGGTGATGASSGTGGSGGASVPQDSYQIKWGPTEVPGGSESTQCVIKRVGNSGRINVHEIHNVLGATSHHFIVYKVNDTVERPTPFGCTPFIDTLNPEEGAPIIITQRADDRLTLPDGVAYVLEPNQMVRLELHYINVSAAPRMAEATSTFIPIPDEEFEQAADIIFMGTGAFELEPGETATSDTVFLQSPPVLDGVNFFAITGHQHQYGTNVRVDTAPDAGGTATSVYEVENFQWDEPETLTYDPPFQLPPGGGFNITCDWNNTSGSTVEFGTGVDDEMCFFWAYYYPSQGSVVCVDEVFGFSFCCPGSPECSFL